MVTTSLELSKRLKEAGWPQHEHLFIWKEWGGEAYLEYCVSIPDRQHPHVFAAPTAEEILEKLPKDDNEFGTLAVTWDDSRWCVGYYTFGKRGEAQWNSFIHCGSLCDSLATMYIYLKEHNLL